MGSLAACAKRQRWLRHRCLRQLFHPASRTDLSATGLTVHACVQKRLYICFTHRRRLLSLRLLACEALFCSLCGLCFWAPCDSTAPRLALCTPVVYYRVHCRPTLLLPTRPGCALGSASVSMSHALLAATEDLRAKRPELHGHILFPAALLFHALSGSRPPGNAFG